MDRRRLILTGARPSWLLAGNPSFQMSLSSGRGWLLSREYRGQVAVEGLLSALTVPAHNAIGSDLAIYSAPTSHLDAFALGSACRGQLIEPPATNLSQYSADLSHAYWSKTRSTVVADSVNGPDGTLTADTVVEDATASQTHSVTRNPVTISASTKYTRTIRLKRKDFDWVQIAFYDGTTFFWGNFNLATGATGNKAASATLYMEALADGYYACTVAFTSGGSASSGQLLTYLSRLTGDSATLAPRYSGDGVSGVYMWGSELKAEAYPTSYIATAGASASRTESTIRRALAGDLSPTEGRIVVTGTTAQGVGTAEQVLWQADDASADNAFTIYRNSTNEIRFRVASGGVTQSDRAVAIVTGEQAITCEMAWSGTTVSYSVNGGSKFYEIGVTMPVSLTHIGIGCAHATGSAWGGYVDTVAHYRASSINAPTFTDSFNRADTSAGDLGTSPNGNGYTMSGAYVANFPLPAATHGQITSKKYVSDANSVVYASQDFGITLGRIGAVVRWDNSSAHAAVETAALIITNSANLLDTMLHLTFSNTQALLQKRVSGGSFVTLATLNYSSLLDGQPHWIGGTLNGTTATIYVDGASTSATDADLSMMAGPYGVWENYSALTDVYPLEFMNVTASA